MSIAYVVMGMSGCGKSHIGASFTAAIGARFIDGDSLHLQANVITNIDNTPDHIIQTLVAVTQELTI